MEILQAVIDYFNHTWGYVELAGTVASAICVYLAIKQNIWTWFWGAIGVSFFGPMFWEYGLLSDAWLQLLFFLPMQVLGWYWWMKRGPNHNNDLPVVKLSTSVFVYIVLSILVIAGINGYAMATHTEASFPYIDALTTWMSIFAQIMMIKKIVESWYLWVAMDIIAIPVYYAKELYVVSGLYVLFLVLATMGGIAWYNAWKEQNAQTV